MPRFRLPQQEELGFWMAHRKLRRRKIFLAKIDLMNCY